MLNKLSKMILTLFYLEIITAEYLFNLSHSQQIRVALQISSYIKHISHWYLFYCDTFNYQQQKYFFLYNSLITFEAQPNG